jgi:hypothetical protein
MNKNASSFAEVLPAERLDYCFHVGNRRYLIRIAVSAVKAER